MQAAEWKAALKEVKRAYQAQERADGKAYDLLNISREATSSQIKRCVCATSRRVIGLWQ